MKRNCCHYCGRENEDNSPAARKVSKQSVREVGMARGIMFVLAMAAFLASCAYPEIVSETPEGIELSCAAGLTCRSSRMDLLDLAKEHCRKYGQKAQQDQLSSSATGKQWATYKCVPLAPGEVLPQAPGAASVPARMGVNE